MLQQRGVSVSLRNTTKIAFLLLESQEEVKAWQHHRFSWVAACGGCDPAPWTDESSAWEGGVYDQAMLPQHHWDHKDGLLLSFDMWQDRNVTLQVPWQPAAPEQQSWGETAVKTWGRLNSSEVRWLNPLHCCCWNKMKYLRAYRLGWHQTRLPAAPLLLDGFDFVLMRWRNLPFISMLP